MTRGDLRAHASFAGVLGAAGLPIYIHAPKFYADTHAIGLATLGAILFGLRCLDLAQDPALGWLSARLRHWRGVAAMAAGLIMALAMLGLFMPDPLLSPPLWFALMLAALFSAFSFLTISFYAQGVSLAAREAGGHLRLAAWRESGALGGIALAAALPSALTFATGQSFFAFALAFAAATLGALLLMAGRWRAEAAALRAPGLTEVLADPRARRLLLIALINAAPVAVSSTLFLFFIDSRIAAPGWEGPLLLAFFVAAAAAAPGWGALAVRIGARPTLLAGMILATASFATAGLLGPGDILPFAAICILSGAAMGADLTLLPALFAARMTQITPEAAAGFGLWSFASKASLALAAVVVLPLLDRAGFSAGGPNSPESLAVLGALYALLPCALKCLAIGLLLATDLKEN
ncbi:MFS transporter [Plastorhodobacter daqingensis]|uniref:MFS transporter n=1 Tax=Plastorhodobacter daqingensis TaxID=1387281 RepID=A0ABW2UP41_9RHOB